MHPLQKPPQSNRRSGTDRRGEDKGPPGTIDRRRGVEPRQPEVVELDMSESQWSALTQSRPGS